MPRRIILSAKGPYEVKTDKESVWICMCGLSKKQPFCDGSHHSTLDEADDKLYEYNKQGQRKEV